MEGLVEQVNLDGDSFDDSPVLGTGEKHWYQQFLN